MLNALSLRSVAFAADLCGAGLLLKNSVYFYSTAAAAKLQAEMTDGVDNVDSGEIRTNYLHEDDQVIAGLLFHYVLRTDA